MKYTTYLKSKHWQCAKKRTKRYFGSRCFLCGCKHVDIHHKTYKRKGNENHKTDLIPLCRKHHYEVHEYAKAHCMNLWNATNKLTKRLHKEAENNTKRLTWSEMTKYERDAYLGGK